MNVKITIKFGDEVIKSNEGDSILRDQHNIEQLIKFKTYMEVMVGIIEAKTPEARDKRIEMIMDFIDDGYYVVIGRKPKEVEGLGT